MPSVSQRSAGAALASELTVARGQLVARGRELDGARVELARVSTEARSLGEELTGVRGALERSRSELARARSQAALARRAGLTGSYISVLESSRRRPPTPRVIRALCKAMGIDDKPLQEAAALERSPPTVRKRLERMRRERGRVEKSRDRLLTTTLFHLAKGPRVVDPMSEFLDLPPGQQAVLARVGTTVSDAEVAAIQQVMIDTGAVAETEAEIEALLDEATAALDELPDVNGSRAALAALADYVVERET